MLFQKTCPNNQFAIFNEKYLLHKYTIMCIIINTIIKSFGGREMKIRVGIVGVTGYTGGELLRLLLNHPQAEVKKATSRSNAGKDVTLAHPNLKDRLT